jgi:hypothetical protein
VLEGVLVLKVFPKMRQDHFLFVGSETRINDLKVPRRLGGGRQERRRWGENRE